MRTSLVLALSLAAIAFSGAALGAGVDPEKATPVQREQAQARFQRGLELVGSKRYDDALTEFRASFDIVASPNTHLLMARCLRDAGKLVEAYAEFGRTAVEAKELAREDTRYRKAGEAADAERREIEPKLGFVTVVVKNATATTRLLVGGEEIRRAAWNEPAPVLPGKAEVVVETPGHEPIKRYVNLSAGGRESVAIDLSQTAIVSDTSEPVASPAPSNHKSLRPIAYAAGGVGVLGFATFAIFGLMANSKYDELKTQCGGPCPTSRSSDISAGKTQQTVANIGLGVGIVGVAAGAALFVISMPPKQSPAAAALVVGPSWIGIQGPF